MQISFLSPLSLLIACLSLGFTATGVRAQQKMVELRFITFPQVQDPLEMELLVAKNQTLKLEIPSNELSEPYRVPRLSNMIFGKATVDKEGKPKFDVYGKGAMAAGSKQTVLILRKGKGGFEQGFEVRAISNDPESFGGGKFLFLNTTGKPIAGFAGFKNQFGIKPGQHTIIKPVLEKDGRRSYMEFYYMTRNAEGQAQSVPFFNSFWPVSEYTRGYVFFYQDPIRDNKITFHSYREFLLEE